MPTHLYCLLAAESDSAPPADVPGVRALVVGPVVAWVSTTPKAVVTRDARHAAHEVMEHDRVIGRALARGVTPVPATLADPYPSDAAVTDDVGRRSAEIMESVHRVEGMVEMAVVLAPRPEAREPSSVRTSGAGRAYLERLRDQPALLGAAADDIDRRLASIIVAKARRAEGDRVGISHLVRLSDIDGYRQAALGMASERYRRVVDGPRAPYSFAAFIPRLDIAKSGAKAARNWQTRP